MVEITFSTVWESILPELTSVLGMEFIFPKLTRVLMVQFPFVDIIIRFLLMPLINMLLNLSHFSFQLYKNQSKETKWCAF